VIGLLGILPILIGLNNLREILLNRDNSEIDISINQRKNARFRGFESRRLSLRQVLRDKQTYQVSAVTISNGGNNLGIYIPLFANSSFPSLIVIILIFFFFIFIWLFLSYNLTRQPSIAIVLSRYASKLFPFVLMWLGLRIIIDNESYKLFISS